MKTKILLVEDDVNLGLLVKEQLENNGFQVDLQKNGACGWNKFNNEKFDLCILDVMMPVEDGFTLATKIRKIDEKTPIIFLTAKSLKEDKINAFKIGADDYVTKPFSTEELVLRINAIMKRINGSKTIGTVNEYEIGIFRFDYSKRILINEEETKRLTSKEAELLRMLCLHKNNLLERNLALQVIWNDESYFAARSMDVYINKLRSYLKQDSSIEIITVHGYGFKLVVG